VSKSKKRKRREAMEMKDKEIIAARPEWREPWLIQRLDVRDSKYGKNDIDRCFSFHYMGSAEFEFGALPKALREMREAPDLNPEPIRITFTFQGKAARAWYVGIVNEQILFYARSLLEDQTGTRDKFRLKEATRMRDAFTEGEDGYGIPDGWWVIDQPVPWLLFKKKEHAKLWLEKMR